MVKLNFKITSSTLIETLVSTVILIAIFTISILALNTIYKSVITNNLFFVENRLDTLKYDYNNGLIALPYIEDYEGFQIEISKASVSSRAVEFVVKKKSGQGVIKKMTYDME